MRLEVSFRVLNKNLDVDFSAKDKKLNAEFQCFQRIAEQGMLITTMVPTRSHQKWKNRVFQRVKNILQKM